MKHLLAHEYEEVVGHITELVNESFTLRPMPSGVITEAEAERRVEICGQIWNTLYGDLRWAREKILDHMGQFLVAILDGKKLSDYTDELQPAGREGSSMWAPQKLKDIEPERRLSALAGSDPVIIGTTGGKSNGS
jgi:hypothetical protein